jgi:sulfur-oxidizing protein SoxY
VSDITPDLSTDTLRHGSMPSGAVDRGPAPERRLFLTALAGVAAIGAGLPLEVLAQPQPDAPVGAAMRAAIHAWTGGAQVNNGRVGMDIAELIDNGNAVPITLTVTSPMTAADHVTGLALFAERNPLPEVVAFTLGPRAGMAEVSTRIRLATSQQLVAIARLSDGSYWQQAAKVIVTLAACIEEPAG